LKFDKKYLRRNQFQALPLELAIKIFGIILGYITATLVTPDGLVWTTRKHLWLTLGFEILRSSFVIFMEGRDSNHLTYKGVPKDPNWIFAGPEFHSLHHVYPDRYIGSFVKVFDWIWGTAYSFKHKRFVITGGSGAFGRAITTQLEREGVRCIRNLKFGIDWDHHQVGKTLPVLAECDILVLAHGSNGQDAVQSNCDSAIRLIKSFKKYRIANPACLTLPEVWYVGSEAELHPSWGIAQLQHYSMSKRKFLPHARSFYDDRDIIYRHIVPSSFHSPMGSAIISADMAAKCAMWWIRRGARYIPVTYTGIAYLNYFNFIYRVPYAQDLDKT
jgi:NAD(P)-dependent dehydrogenase (short-subunit alcohol dehydrogenase family)